MKRCGNAHCRPVFSPGIHATGVGNGSGSPSTLPPFTQANRASTTRSSQIQAPPQARFLGANPADTPAVVDTPRSGQPSEIESDTPMASRKSQLYVASAPEAASALAAACAYRPGRLREMRPTDSPRPAVGFGPRRRRPVEVCRAGTRKLQPGYIDASGRARAADHITGLVS